MNIRTQIGALITIGTMIAVGCKEDVTSPPDEVTEPTVGSIVLQLEADTLWVNETTQVQVTVLSADGDTLTDEAITFLSSNDDIVTVSDTGLVTAEAPGTATLTAQVDDVAATAVVYVRRAASISVAPADTTLIVNDTLRLTATVLDEVGNPAPDAVIRWILDPASVLSAFDTDGLTAGFVAVIVGSAQITAETEGLTFAVNVQVDPSEVGSILVTPDSLTVAVGDSSRLTVVVRDTTGAVIPTPNLDWFCGFNDPANCLTQFATIDATGLVTGISPYLAMEVVAQSKGVESNSIYITVEP